MMNEAVSIIASVDIHMNLSKEFRTIRSLVFSSSRRQYTKMKTIDSWVKA